MATKKTTVKTAAKATVKKNEEKIEVTPVVEEAIVEKIVEKVIEKTIEEVKPVAVSEPVIVEEKKTFTDSDYILCRSVCAGGLNVVSQSGNLYEFKDYGAECEINYRDLVTLIRRGSDHVFLPRFVILDEDFLEEFPTVQRVYGEMYTKDDLETILELPLASMKSEINKLPESTKNSMRNLVATQIANGKLDSIAKVRALTEIFNSDFNLLSELLVK